MHLTQPSIPAWAIIKIKILILWLKPTSTSRRDRRFISNFEFEVQKNICRWPYATLQKCFRQWQLMLQLVRVVLLKQGWNFPDINAWQTDNVQRFRNETSSLRQSEIEHYSSTCRLPGLLDSSRLIHQPNDTSTLYGLRPTFRPHDLVSRSANNFTYSGPCTIFYCI